MSNGPDWGILMGVLKRRLDGRGSPEGVRSSFDALVAIGHDVFERSPAAVLTVGLERASKAQEDCADAAEPCTALHLLVLLPPSARSLRTEKCEKCDCEFAYLKPHPQLQSVCLSDLNDKLREFTELRERSSRKHAEFPVVAHVVEQQAKAPLTSDYILRSLTSQELDILWASS